MAPRGFYEEDEPSEEVLAAWDAGEPGETAPPPELANRPIYFDWTRGTGLTAELRSSGDAEYAVIR